MECLARTGHLKGSGLGFGWLALSFLPPAVVGTLETCLAGLSRRATYQWCFGVGFGILWCWVQYLVRVVAANPVPWFVLPLSVPLAATGRLGCVYSVQSFGVSFCMIPRTLARLFVRRRKYVRTENRVPWRARECVLCAVCLMMGRPPPCCSAAAAVASTAAVSVTSVGCETLLLFVDRGQRLLLHPRFKSNVSCNSAFALGAQRC